MPIYTISILQIARIGLESRGGMGAQMMNMDFLQADNEMKTFSKETGGLSFFPRFTGEYPQIFRQIETAMREQYSLTYHPTNIAKDGKFRRIKVELVDPATNEPYRVAGRQRQANEVSGHRQGRLQSAARSRIKQSEQLAVDSCQELDLSCFEFDSGLLTLRSQDCYLREVFRCDPFLLNALPQMPSYF